MQLIPYAEAMEITKHRTEMAFRVYVRRINAVLPEQSRVVRTRGMVEKSSLEIAIAAYARRKREKAVAK